MAISQKSGAKDRRAGIGAAGAPKAASARWSLAVVLVAVLASFALPFVASALDTLPEPDYSWYTDDADTYIIGSEDSKDSEAEYLGFVNLVNGTADVDGDGTAEAAVTFEGKTVKLGDDLSFEGNALTPVGGAANGDAEFDGTFDGQGHSIQSFTIDAGGSTENVGLFGKTGENSLIENVEVNGSLDLSVDSSSADGTVTVQDIGLLVGESAGSIANCSLSNGASVTIEQAEPADSSESVGALLMKNVGGIAGSVTGSMANCSTSGSVSVTDHSDQTKSLIFPVQNVGGLGGLVLGDITGCSHAGTLSVTEDGAPYAPTAEEESSWQGADIMAMSIGGVVGCAGDPDSSMDSTELDRSYSNTHGSIASCKNSGTVTIDTPSEAGYDRFGNKLYAISANVGGIAGYARDSIDGCANTGFLDCVNATSIGGIVGNMRGATTPTNFSEEGTDDGVLLEGDGEAETLTVTNCTNGVSSSDAESTTFKEGTVYGRAYCGGIVGRTGTYVTVQQCVNQETAMVYGTRTTKPFPAGIVGSCYGTVAYCANLGTVISGKKSDTYATEYTTGGGYYAAGLAGGTFYYTQKSATDSTRYVRVSPLPEVYGCYNAGDVLAIDNMRQRALVGDNSGSVHDNAALEGTVYNNRLVYGIYDGDNETSGGTAVRNTLVTDDQLKGTALLSASQMQGKVIDDETLESALAEDGTSSVLTLLNGNCDKDGWSTYWAKSNGTDADSLNAGYPVFGSQVTWASGSLEDATVELAANAEYTGKASVPQATVTLADGTNLVQGADFKVVPDSEEYVEVTDEGETPYTATIVGIGEYADSTASSPLYYGIDKGELSNCTVSIDSVKFNWDGQTPDASEVHVYNLAGDEVDSSEYTVALDGDDSDLTDGEAVNSGNYTVDVTATDDSEHFKGSTTGTFTIESVKILCSTDSDKADDYAVPTSISYDGETTAVSGEETVNSDGSYAWYSTTVHPDDGAAVTFQYTGKSIKPTVDSVTYLGRELTKGVDYNVIYGTSLMDGGSVEESGTENVGTKDAVSTGGITVRYVSGGNFQNQESMYIGIDGTQSDSLDIGEATVTGTEDIVYEEGQTYTPITVSYGGSVLTEGEDYTIAYKNNDQVGTATYTITGIGEFGGTKIGSFNIVEGAAYDLAYSYDDTAKTATVTGVTYNGSAETFNLVIPETTEYNGTTYTVTAIADKACGGSLVSDFQGDEDAAKQKIASVTIPKTVTSIGSYAFGSGYSSYTMSQLKSVTFRDGSALTTIGEGAFDRTGITSVTIPAGVTTIGNLAFANNASLDQVMFLSRTDNLEAMTTTINKMPFYNDTQLTVFSSAQVSQVKKHVDYVTFTYSSQKYLWTWKQLCAVAFNANGGSAVDTQILVAGKTASKPANPTRSGYTFGGWYTNKALTKSYSFSTKVSDDLTLYAKWTKGSSSSSQVTGLAKGKSAVAGSGSSRAVYTATGSSTVTYKRASSLSAKKLSVPSKVKINGKTYRVTKIADKAFNKAKATSVTVGSNVTVIKAKTFYGAKKMRTLTLGSGVKKIAAKAFAKNRKLKKIVVKTKRLTKKASVRNALKSSAVKTVQVKVGNTSQNKRYVKKYRKTLGAKSVSGKRVSVKR
ncbi:MAG: leucine-rich repeat protein [Eggerthellaceae bacterium]|jgi:uncharacterized repeat protein (TIGR02543 family)